MSTKVPDRIATPAGMAAARKASDKAPILLLCTKAKLGSAVAGMKAGATGIVSKPFTGEEILAALAKAAEAGKKKGAAVNVEFINPFIEATRNLFSTMCGMKVDRKSLFLKNDHQMFGDISGVMGLSGAATGSVVISMPGRLACEAVGKMLGEAPMKELNESVCDGVAEIINMIAGQAKAALAKTKYHFTISLPTVVKGTGHEIAHKQGTPNIVVIFGAGAQEFAIQVCLAPGE